ncbi:MAG: radical SAM family heme chaperone HemW [Peptostreptococcaceae bacterium]|nr:radical SAM family heme chaperone HemW [Peptostreptococcaceae bacterium]
MRNIGVYTHIPFCLSKCNYCDFDSHVGSYEEKKEYIGALKKEIQLLNIKYGLEKYVADTIFIGGGTPTSLEEDLLFELLQTLQSSFTFSSHLEATIEMNPSSFSASKIDILKNSFINRVSIGLQSCIQDELALLGRNHDLQDFDTTFNYLRNNNFDNINVDLMMGLPNQSLEKFSKTLDTVLYYNPEHISAYMLIIEEGTPFYKWYENGKIIVDDKITLQIYEYTVKKLKESGYEQYEISNFAKKGKSCSHNIKYWTLEEYLGIGRSAASFIDGYRYKNADKEYVKIINSGKLPIVDKEKSVMQTLYEENIFLGLRMTQGIDIKKLNEKFDIDFMQKYSLKIEQLLKKDLIKIREGKLSLTLKGIEISNQIFLEFI